MHKQKIISIITIACLCSIILIPIGIVLMWFSTPWKKMLKSILSGVLGILYIALVTLILLLEPSYNTSGVSLPISYNQGYTAFEQSTKSPSKQKDSDEEQKNTKEEKSKKKTESEDEGKNITGIKKSSGTRKLNQASLSLLFFLLIFLLIIRQNLKAKKKTGYENPYVDTGLYKLPLSDDAKIPMVHFLRLKLNPSEKILFATETNKKDDEGDFVVTNQRIAFFSLSERGEIPLKNLESVSSVSNTVIQLISGDRKYFFFLPESQVKYALAIIRWAFKKIS